MITKRPESNNERADFWRYHIGANVIPADTRNKRPLVEWKQYQNAPVSEEQHSRWKEEGAFNHGMAIMAGKVWHNESKKNLHLICLDFDNQKAIDEFCTNLDGVKVPLSELAKYMIIEQHADDASKAHVIFYATHPFMKKSSDIIGNELAEGIDRNEIPAIEVKGAGEHGILFCSPSPHANGYRYQIIGTFEPQILDESELHIDTICRKYHISYLAGNKNNNKESSLVPIRDLWKEDTRIHEGHNRHEALLRVMESLILRLGNIFTQNQIKNLANKWNRIHCVPPLEDKVFERQWQDALEFVAKNDKLKKAETRNFEFDSEEDFTISEFADNVIKKFHIVTLSDTEEILYFRCGVYTPGGHTIIKAELERTDPNITWTKVKEVLEKIRRRTFVNRDDFDKNLSILNVRNGLLSLSTGEILPHDHSYLSLSQLPIIFDKKATCPVTLRFLAQVLRPKNIFTAIQFIGYCLYHGNNYEKALLCVGGGSNGKSTFLKILENFLGRQNVSHASLQDLNTERFATANLYGKMANIFADLKTEKVTNSGLFKAIVSGDMIRAQNKHQNPFDFVSHAKLIFSTNEIPETEDKSYAYFRRWIILFFDNVFEDGKDTSLINKLTTEKELSGLLNLALIGLKQLIADGGFIHVEDVRTIEADYRQNRQHRRAISD